MKRTLLFSCAVLSALLLAGSVSAADYLPKNKAEIGNVVIDGTTPFKNLYAFGGTVMENKEVKGDLFVAGGSVNIVGGVEKDLVAAGGNVNLSGPVGENAKIGGGNVIVNAPVGGDLLLAGGTINISQAAKVSGDLWIAGGMISLNAPVSGLVKIVGGEIFINSKIDGSVDVRSTKKLTFGPLARVSGKISYTGKEEAVIEDGAQVSPIQFQKLENAKAAPVNMWALFAFAFVFKLLLLLVTSFVFLLLFRNKMNQATVLARSSIWANLGIGFAGMILIPIAIVLLLVTVVGVYVAFMLIFVLILLALFAGVGFVALMGTLLERLFKKEYPAVSWKTILLGILGLFILSVIPIVGWLAMLVLYIVSFGALLRLSRQQLEF